jgi:SCP-2 sterol transfer family
MRLKVARALLARMVDGADDVGLERRFGRPRVQRILFRALAASFEPLAAEGFEGRLSYELTRPATGSSPYKWTVEVSGRRAHATPGGADDAALKIRMTVSDFVRIAAGTIDPAIPLLQDRASFKGDLALAARLPEMFGA